MAKSYYKGFIPYAAAALMVGVVGGFAAVLPPALVQDLGLAYNNTTWSTLALAMSSAACAPILGRLGDVLGRKVTLLLGIAVFAIGNALTALSSTLIPVLISRFIVGIGTAAIAPVILSYIVTEFPPEEMARGFSLYMLISSSAVIFSPTIGGFIIESASWQAMVWLCAAIALGVFIFCFFFRENAPRPRGTLAGFDGFGALAILIFFSLALCLPAFGQNFGWSSRAFLLTLAASVAAFAGLLLAESRAKNPILQKSFLARRAFILPVLALFLTQGLMQANMTNTIVFVNYTQPENTIISSYAISIMYFGMSLGSVFAAPLADRYEPRNVLTITLAATGAGCALMLAFTPDASALLLALSLGVLGLGLGGNATIFLKVVLTGLDARSAGAGTGTYGLFRDLSAPFGVAVLVPLFTNSITARVQSAAISDALAAVEAIRMLAVVELFCVGLGIILVRLLPRVHAAELGKQGG